MKTHISLPTRDLSASVAFYRTLLDSPPAKHYDDYALFVAERPGLELALAPSSHARPDPSAHFGIAVEDADAVNKAVARLQSAGLPVDVETEKICCYARQSKVWSTDPDGRRWEVYYVIEETEQAMDTDSPCCANDTGANSPRNCCA